MRATRSSIVTRCWRNCIFSCDFVVFSQKIDPGEDRCSFARWCGGMVRHPHAGGADAHRCRYCGFLLCLWQCPHFFDLNVVGPIASKAGLASDTHGCEIDKSLTVLFVVHAYPIVKFQRAPMQVDRYYNLAQVWVRLNFNWLVRGK